MSRSRRALSEAEPTPSEQLRQVNDYLNDLGYYEEATSDVRLARLSEAAASSVYGTTTGKADPSSARDNGDAEGGGTEAVEENNAG